MTEQWIKAAHEALRQVQIVDEQDRFPAPFKGYVSSFGAAVAQSGLLAASLFFENSESDAEANRSLVVQAVVEVLHRMCCLSDEQYQKESLARVVYEGNCSSNLLTQVDQAVAALKLALRDFSGEDMKSETSSFGCTIDRDKYAPVEYSKAEFDELFPLLQANGANMGWLFYRDYYRDMDIDPYPIEVKDKDKDEDKDKGTDQEIRFQRKNEQLLSATLGELGEQNKQLIEALQPTICFDLTTTYPGLLIGSGLAHGTGMDHDLKIGLSFDYTTGLPYVAGSAVKGVLRSMFPSLAKEISKEDKLRIDYLNEKCQKNLSADEWKKLTAMLFDANRAGTAPSRVLFFDAMIIGSTNQSGQILGDDFITPHKSPIKNPIPLQFLKVLPGVTFRFAFRMDNRVGELTVEQVGALFRAILLDVGVGAKTNVGYGQFKAN